MDEKEYKDKVGHSPENDELERVNCQLHGAPGHYFCGWCEKHDKPRYECGCMTVIG